jgi:hypothetical protein
VRFPSWAPRETVIAMRNGKIEKPDWAGSQNAYVRFDEVKKGEKLVLFWQIPTFSQTLNVLSIPPQTTELRVEWLGNAVQSVMPSGRYLPMFHRQNLK